MVEADTLVSLEWWHFSPNTRLIGDKMADTE
jgi:hypothetical protein